MPGFLTVPLTVYPFSSSSLTSHDAMYPAAPVTHTVCPFPAGCCTAAAAAALSDTASITVILTIDDDQFLNASLLFGFVTKARGGVVAPKRRES
jgi:hypothetical protein